MSVEAIQQRLDSYHCRSQLEEEHALREITQEVILAALGRTDFFQHAVFQGGTCLRIFYRLNRFSEDLDFALRTPGREFTLGPFLAPIGEELRAYGYAIEVADRSLADGAVRTAFLKDDSIGKMLGLAFRSRRGPDRKIRVRLEVDTNPPLGGAAELKHLDFPFVSAVAVHDLPSLFAGKLHALLCRRFHKGRDWYDFLWYTARRAPVNFELLSAAIDQTGPWKDQHLRVDAQWCHQQLHQKISQADWKATAEDVRAFLNPIEWPSLDLWSAQLFLDRLERIR